MRATPIAERAIPRPGDDEATVVAVVELARPVRLGEALVSVARSRRPDRVAERSVVAVEATDHQFRSVAHPRLEVVPGQREARVGARVDREAADVSAFTVRNRADLAGSRAVEAPEGDTVVAVASLEPAHHEVVTVDGVDDRLDSGGPPFRRNAELLAQARRLHVEASGEDPLRESVLVAARPGHDEPTVARKGHARQLVGESVHAVDPERRADRFSLWVEAPGKDVPRRGTTVGGGPHQERPPRGVGGDHQLALIARRLLVDNDLGRRRGQGRVEAARDDRAGVAILTEGGPGDPGGAEGVERHGRMHLVAVGRLVDLDLVTERRAVRVEAPREDAVGAVLLPAALPHRQGSPGWIDVEHHAVLGAHLELVGAPVEAVHLLAAFSRQSGDPGEEQERSNEETGTGDLHQSGAPSEGAWEVLSSCHLRPECELAPGLPPRWWQ